MSPAKIPNIQYFASKTYNVTMKTYEETYLFILNINFKNPYLHIVLIDFHKLFFLLFIWTSSTRSQDVWLN